MEKKRFCEVGSEFWNIPTLEAETESFSADIEWFLSGRNALRAILKEIKRKRSVSSVALPAWCCESMILPFVKEGINVKFYPTFFENRKIKKDLSVASSCDMLLIMDYFGYTEDNTEQKFEGIVIRDLTHSIFSKKYDDANYYFGSLRKWAGFWTGGFAKGIATESLKTDEKYVALRKKAMELKESYINGFLTSKRYLEIFATAENFLSEVDDVVAAVERDISAAMKLDVDTIKKQRRKNAEVLLGGLGEMAMFSEIKPSDCPLFVPIMVPDKKRDALRNYLVEKEIYCPVHWSLSKYHICDERTLEIYENELSIVCDQRYDQQDMERIVNAVQMFWRK